MKKVDRIANIVKMVEDLDLSATILPNLTRSIQIDAYSSGAQSVYMSDWKRKTRRY